jgi:CBS domain-containing protein
MFSDPGKTRWSGWKYYNELDELKKLLFEDYHGRTTILDADKVEEAYSSKHDNFLVLMTTDGEIFNPEAKEACRKVIENGNDFVIFQTMSRSEFAEYMRKHGATVVYVDKPEDLVGLVLRKVGEKYSRIIVDRS